MNQRFDIQLTNLLDTGLPDEAIEALTAGSPAGLLSPEGMTTLVRDFAHDFRVDDRLVGIGDLIDRLGATASPLDTATQLINYKYTQLGASSGPLGSPTSAVVGNPDGTGFRREFNYGVIYWHPATGAHEVHGAIRAKWVELGAQGGFLGYPTTDQTPGRDAQSRGAFDNHFRGGSIYWHPGLPIIDVHGVELIPGAVGTSFLGNMAQPETMLTTSRPIESMLSASHIDTMGVLIDRSSVADAGFGATGRGAAASGIDRHGVELVPGFDLSTIQPSSAGANEVHGAILANYLAMGAEASILGYPTSDEGNTQGGGGRLSRFEAGAIYWSGATGACEIHGLIRDFWNAHGANQGAFGFPITDELIPDRRLGHVRPETKRKPIVDLPIDVIKLPADAVGLNFSSAIVNAGVSRTVSAANLAGAARVTGGISAERIVQPSAAEMAVGASLLERDNPNLLTLMTMGEASSPAPSRSDNRFEDFESGVLFWRRGATAATQVAPWLQASDGSKMHWTAAEVQAAAQPVVGRAFTGLAGLVPSNLAYQGTTAYSFDGAGVHNRRHRFQVSMFGGLLGGIPMPVIAEIHVEVTFDPLARKVVAFVANWLPLVVPALNTDPNGQLHRTLDPILWSRFELAQLPDTDNGNPIAVLSVKTLSSGDVNVYIEPNSRLIDTHGVLETPGFSILANQ